MRGSDRRFCVAPSARGDLCDNFAVERVEVGKTAATGGCPRPVDEVRRRPGNVRDFGHCVHLFLSPAEANAVMRVRRWDVAQLAGSTLFGYLTKRTA